MAQYLLKQISSPIISIENNVNRNSEPILIKQTKEFVRKHLEHAEGGHDWWHIVRVHRNALNLAEKYEVNYLVIELAALLHDIAEPKFHQGNEETGPKLATDFLRSQDVDEIVVKEVEYIIRHMSFKNTFSFSSNKSLEFQIVEDADRLDAIGAIGVARAFSFGGYKLRPFYDPDVPPAQFTNSEKYKASTSPTINHFYEKLLLIKDMMNTDEAKAMAEKRHLFMLRFLDEFYSEWEGQS